MHGECRPDYRVAGSNPVGPANRPVAQLAEHVLVNHSSP
jgi:hypothetical protein